MPVPSPRWPGRGAWRVKVVAAYAVAVQASASGGGESLIAYVIAIVGSLGTVMGEVDR